ELQRLAGRQPTRGLAIAADLVETARSRGAVRSTTRRSGETHLAAVDDETRIAVDGEDDVLIVVHFDLGKLEKVSAVALLANLDARMGNQGEAIPSPGDR